MIKATRTIVAVVVLTVIAAAAGVWVGMNIVPKPSHHSTGLDEILHHELGLTPEQERRISDLEAKFALDRKDLESEMRSSNRELARALEAEHGYGDQAKTAISHFHMAMGKLQEMTILHVLEMRSVLTPEQAEKFDKTVRQALSADPP